ncbi:DUF305 domain-containing protein [Streptomyces beijiangensis]|uniref:DUF305 domain-containing protein n=1 Tax=Streptomyces beijiangensis TaxID=163361 RepID=A0A939JFU6_9ACTN|nr:DUF305 domain-containing protein [Streptomyces beijiangensis]MBO0510857.1 DUF305 domain-containing protein [Streptomyces beijiangensis]
MAAVAAVVLALLFAAAATVASARSDGGGSDGSSSSAARTPATGSADAGFARDMSVHHQQAVEMSFIVRDRTDNADVRRLAYDIANTQANQRGMMLGWLNLWGLPVTDAGALPMAWMGMGEEPPTDGALMPGMATRAQLTKLGEVSGKQAEILYLQLMTAHHKGGIHMAEGCVELCKVPTEKKLAQGMVDGQKSEIQLMADLLKARGATATAPR